MNTRSCTHFIVWLSWACGLLGACTAQPDAGDSGFTFPTTGSEGTTGVSTPDTDGSSGAATGEVASSGNAPSTAGGAWSTGDPSGTASGSATGTTGAPSGTATGSAASPDAGGSDAGAMADAGAMTDAGTMADAAGMTGSTSDPQTGIRLTDPVPGWASVATSALPQGTIGGGSDLGQAITVSSMRELQDAVSGSSAAIILVRPGTYSGELRPGANKTILGEGPGVLIQGSVKISGPEVSNVIMRNVAVRGDRCGSYEDCKSGPDAVYIGDGAHHVWLDHVDIADGQDGNCDVTQAADYVTVSWSKFHYTYDKEHRFSNLIAGSDSETRSRGKLRISYLRCWWGDRVEQRSPRGRFGKVHMLNNYHSSKDTSYVAGPGVEAQFLVESCFYEINSGRPAFSSYGASAAWKGVGNEGNADGMNSSQGDVFTPPYEYSKWPASEVKAALTTADCGAGNTCDLE